MKIGIALGAYNRFGDDKYKKLRKFGFSAVDYPMADTGEFIYSAPFSEAKAYLLHQKSLADNAGIIINQVHGPWRWPPRDESPENRAERMEKMKRSIEMTALLGTKNWVIHPLEPFGIHDLEIGKVQETAQINFSFFSELLSTAKDFGVTICLENTPWEAFSLARPLDILRFIKEINDKNLKACLDTGHTAAVGESAGETVRLLKDELRALHVHDSTRGADLHLPPYFGRLDFNDFGKALKEIEFSGVLSLETAPSTKLPDYIFSEMSELYCKIAKNIIKQ